MIESAISDHRPVTCDFEMLFSPREAPLPKLIIDGDGSPKQGAPIRPNETQRH